MTPPNPAVGTEYIYTVPGDTRVQLVSVMCEFAASGVGADRGVSLAFKTWTGRRFLVAGTAATVAPGTSQAFAWQSAAGAGVWAVDDAALAGMPEVTLLPMCSVTIKVTGLDAGDQLSDIAIALDVYPPRDPDAGEVANPLLDALQELNVQGIADDVRALTATMERLSSELADSRDESRRARFQREALALRAG